MRHFATGTAKSRRIAAIKKFAHFVSSLSAPPDANWTKKSKEKRGGRTAADDCRPLSTLRSKKTRWF
jgi:hypothetical protein